MSRFCASLSASDWLQLETLPAPLRNAVLGLAARELVETDEGGEGVSGWSLASERRVVRGLANQGPVAIVNYHRCDAGHVCASAASSTQPGGNALLPVTSIPALRRFTTRCLGRWTREPLVIVALKNA